MQGSRSRAGPQGGASVDEIAQALWMLADKLDNVCEATNNGATTMAGPGSKPHRVAKAFWEDVLRGTKARSSLPEESDAPHLDCDVSRQDPTQPHKMPKALTPARLRARANAYAEAADHLRLAWTDDETERDEGDRLTRMLQAECDRLRAIANAREFRDPRLLPG